MIRPFTLVSALLFVGSGLYLYQTKHAAEMTDRQIHHVREATEAMRERAGMLLGQYQMLNNPQRLAELAASYLPALKATQPTQWSSLADLDRRLPAVSEQTIEPAPLEPDAPPELIVPMVNAPLPAFSARAGAQLISIATMTRPAIVASPATAAPAVAGPAVASPAVAGPAVAARTVAVATVAVPAGAGAATAMRTTAPPASAATTLARAAVISRPVPRPVPRPVAAVAQVASARPAIPVQTNLAHGSAPLAAAPPATTAEAIARIARGGPVDAGNPAVASALGMARTILPVSPVSPASAATFAAGATR